jgi:hypothetical protein
MREGVVDSVSESVYSQMIGDLVNDAKLLVESAYPWSALRTTITIETEIDVFNYELNGVNSNFQFLNFINETSRQHMQYRPSKWFDDKYLIEPVLSGSPQYFTYNGTSDDGDTKIDLYPKPDAVYTLYFNCVARQPDLVEDTDFVQVPWQPIMHLALALATRERGETGGTSVAEYFSIAEKSLSDFIALDAGKHPEEMIFQVT